MVVWCPLSSVRGCVRIALQIRINLLELGDKSGGNPFVSVVNSTSGGNPFVSVVNLTEYCKVFLLTHNVCNNKNLFINITKKERNISTVAEGETTKRFGKGTICLFV